MKTCDLDLSAHAIPLVHFDFNSATDTLSAEASTLEANSGGSRNVFRMHRLYADACDVGIAIRSHHSGKFERFVFTKEDRTPDNEVAGWNFIPVDPRCRVKHVLIIND